MAVGAGSRRWFVVFDVHRTGGDVQRSSLSHVLFTLLCLTDRCRWLGGEQHGTEPGAHETVQRAPQVQVRYPDRHCRRSTAEVHGGHGFLVNDVNPLHAMPLRWYFSIFLRNDFQPCCFIRFGSVVL